MHEKHTIGVDVSKRHFDVEALSDRDGRQARRFAYTPDGIAQFLAWATPLAPDLIVMEATGGLERALALAVEQAGLAVAVVNPSQIRHFARAAGILAKSDGVDAHVIARFGRQMQPCPRPLRRGALAELAQLQARRRQVVGMITAEKNRLHSAQGKLVGAGIRKVLRTLEREVDKLEAEIARLIAADDAIRQREALLRSVPGVGAVVARTVLSELSELGSLSHKQIASLVGLAPHPRESGRWCGKRAIQGGRAWVRSTLYMAALTASRCNPVLRAFYQRLRAQNKPPKLALVACARKLLIMLNAMVRNGSSWTTEPTLA